jgi:ribose-phosphate pyrophosphokinase
VDDLHAEPLIARWIRNHVPDWKEAVVVSKNPGGSKRVTSLADALKLNFGIITTDRRRSPPMNGSMILDQSILFSGTVDGANDCGLEPEPMSLSDPVEDTKSSTKSSPRINSTTYTSPHLHRHTSGTIGASPLAISTRVDSESPPVSRVRLQRSNTAPPPRSNPETDDSADEYTDERAREVITGRLIQGHIVDESYPSPMLSTMSGSIATLPGELIGPSQFEERDPMTSSFMSGDSTFQPRHALGGTYDASMSDEEEAELKNPELEHTVTLVGNVSNKTVFIIDDMIDGSGSWVAAAETVVKRGDAKKVYCIATHGLFGGDCLQVMENCQCIDHILVSNTFPIDPDLAEASKKLIVLDLSGLLAEAIRRNHYGESISQLYQHYTD